MRKCRLFYQLLLGRFTVNKVNFFLEVENNSNNVETKFHGRRISIDEVIKSINVNFLFFRSIFFVRSIFALLLFLRVSTLYSKRDNSDNLEMVFRYCWWYQGGVCCRKTVTGISVLHMLNILM